MPKYDLSNTYRAQCAQERLTQLIKLGKWVEIREIQIKRTISQNSLYWIWLQCLQNETGYDKTDLHLLYRSNFIPKDEETVTKIMKPEVYQKVMKFITDFRTFKGLELIIDIISRSTKDLEVDEFTKYLNQIKDHARANFGVTLLNLEENNFMEFYKLYV